MRNYIQLVGFIWQPLEHPCSMTHYVDAYDVHNMTEDGESEITRDDIEQWVACNSGDFQHVIDFAAYIDGVEFPFATEDGETLYLDTLPSEDY